MTAGCLTELDSFRAATVAVVYDEVEGLNFYKDYGLVDAAFANPELAKDREHRQAVLGYLTDPSVSPLPLRRLAARDPTRASRPFATTLKRPGFSWERDGEALLRRHEPDRDERAVLPSVIPVSDALLDHGSARRPRRTRSSEQGGTR
jgi:hypothetical protein